MHFLSTVEMEMPVAVAREMEVGRAQLVEGLVRPILTIIIGRVISPKESMSPLITVELSIDKKNASIISDTPTRHLSKNN